MASPRLTVIQSEKTTVTSSRVSRSSMSDDDIWKRLQEAGFDEDSIKRRDKASLIAYITKLEAEIYDHQYQMGLLIMERKEWGSKFERVEAALNSAELMRKHDKNLYLKDLAEAKKREENLKKAIEIERECLANIEKTLHELRAEYAETKVMADSKLVEARSMMEDALKKLSEADAKKHAAESLEAEASRYHSAAERKLHEVEAREDDLRRRATSFKTECDTKEEEILHERRLLNERQKALQQSQQRLVDGQDLLNKRESHIFERTQELNRKEKELEASKLKQEEELQALVEQQANLETKASSLSLREEVITKSELEVKKREEELCVLQEKLEKKESERIHQLLANYEASLSMKKSEFEAELEVKRKSVHDDIENKRRDWELREVDLHHREELILEKEHELEMQSRAVVDKERDLAGRFSLLEEKENRLHAVEKEIESKEALLQKEKEEIICSKLDIQRSLDALEDEKKQLHDAEEKMEAMKSETNELCVLESKLKEEIETIRAQKQELETEADEMKELKLKFEIEWQSIDEKRKELQKEAECINEQRESLELTLKDERNSLKLEKVAMRDEYMRNNESLSRDREDFMKKMEHERSEWFSKIQKERSDFLLAIEVQSKDLEDRLAKRREEIESYLAERERAFEEEKKKELMRMDTLRETLARETEQVNAELNRLDTERREINLDRERRDKEWAELNTLIEELKVQRQKLEKQRELMRADKEEILVQIEHLKQLEDLKVVPDRIALADNQQSDLQPSKRVSARRSLKRQSGLDSGCRAEDDGNASSGNGSVILSPPLSSPFSWLKRCASSLLEQKVSNKKMRHSEEIITPSTISARLNVPADEHAVISANRQTPVHAKETTVYIDKIITIREVTSFNDAIVDGNDQNLEEALSQRANEKLEDDNNIESEKPEKNGEVDPKIMQASLTEHHGPLALADIDWDNLGFAFVPTDYMYVMKCDDGENFTNGELQRFGNIELSPCAGVLNYGQGLLEGLKAYKTEDGNILLFRPGENGMRLCLGAERMCMASPSVDQFVKAVKDTVLANERWIPPPGKGSLYIRPLLMGSGSMLSLAPGLEYTFLIYVTPVGNYFKDGLSPIDLMVETETHRATPGGTGCVKTIGNYAAVMKAQRAAKAKGYSDVLYLDSVHKKYLEEVSSCNLFIVKGNVISTPATEGTILPGITRKSIIALARGLKYQVEEKRLTVDELLDADEVFVTGTAVVLSPVGSITYFDKRISYGTSGVGAVTQQLYTALTRLQMGLAEDSMDWIVKLK